MGQITWNTDCNAPCCPGEIVADDGRTYLPQPDFEYPAVARNFGWDMRAVQRCPACGKGGVIPSDCCYDGRCGNHGCRVYTYVICDHEGTDGTVPCKECGLTAGDFISAAYDWLRDNDGATADDPGYFLED